jgi:F-type H+-transporting ATPase subunit b
MLKLDVTFLFVLIAFPIAYAILKRYLFDPLAAILQERDRDARTAEQIHKESLEALSKTVARAEQQLAQARQEALKQREALRAEGRAQWEKKLAEAQTSARAHIDDATREIQAQAESSSRELPAQARTLARELAEKLLGRTLAA